jgi:hypothetical protein
VIPAGGQLGVVAVTRAGAGRWLVPLTSTLGAAADDMRHLDLEEATADDVGHAFQAALAALGGVEALEPAVVAATEYFGGVGSQAAAVVQHGRLSAGPFLGSGAINQALRAAGVQIGAFVDEFEAVGLHRWRWTDDIAKDGE